jgi:hypothetical protein
VQLSSPFSNDNENFLHFPVENAGDYPVPDNYRRTAQAPGPKRSQTTTFIPQGLLSQAPNAELMHPINSRLSPSFTQLRQVASGCAMGVRLLSMEAARTEIRDYQIDRSKFSHPIPIRYAFIDLK